MPDAGAATATGSAAPADAAPGCSGGSLRADGWRSTHIQRVLLLSVGFWLCFAAYGCAQMLQSSVNGAGDVGLACLAAVYVALAVSSLATPLLLSLDARVVTAALPLCAAVYALMVGANIAPAAGPLLASCTAVGLAAAPFWSAQGLYVQRSAAAYARARALPLTRANSYANSAFFSLLSSSGIASAAIATFFVLALDAAAVRDLFIFMTALGAAAALILACLPEPGDEASSAVFSLPCARRCGLTAAAAPAPAAAPPAALLVQPSDASSEWQTGVLVSVAEGEKSAPPLAAAAASDTAAAPAFAAAPSSAVVPTPLYMLRFIFSERRMRWSIPLIFEHGVMQGLFNGAVLGSLSRSDGIAAVCIVSVIFSVGALVANLAWHGPLQRPSHGRRWAFVWAYAAHAVFVACLLAWALAAPPPTDEAVPPAVGVGDPRILLAAAALAIVYAIGDTVFFSQIPATLQTFFPGGGDTPQHASCAMASIRLFSSAGNAASTVVSIVLGPQRFWLQYLLTLIGIAAAAASTWHLHKSVCSLDGDAVAGRVIERWRRARRASATTTAAAAPAAPADSKAAASKTEPPPPPPPVASEKAHCGDAGEPAAAPIEPLATPSSPPGLSSGQVSSF